MREDSSPASRVLAYLPDGALLGAAKRAVVAGGVTWAEVILFSGEQGWASAQYLSALSRARGVAAPPLLSSRGASPVMAPRGPKQSKGERPGPRTLVALD